MTEQEITKRIEEIDAEINKLHKKISDKTKNLDDIKSFQEYEALIEYENSKISKLSREKRMIMPYELSDIPKYGNVMSLKSFIKDVKNGCFIDYDGSGNYIKDDKMTDIVIYPSDVEYNSIRKDFDKIIWFNK